MLREILQVLRSEYAFALITASLAVLLAVIAFELVGYLGLAMLGLLPRIAQQVNAVQSKNALHKSRAVGPPRSDAAPLIVGALKKCER